MGPSLTASPTAIAPARRDRRCGACCRRLQPGALPVLPLRRTAALSAGRRMGLRDGRNLRRGDLLERPRRRRARRHRRRGVQRILRLAHGHRPGVQSRRPAADVRCGHVARRRGVRRRARGRRVPHRPRRLADPGLRAPRRPGRDLLRRAADPLGLSRPGRDRDRALVRTVDGAGQSLSAHATRCRGAHCGRRSCRGCSSWRSRSSMRFPIFTRIASSASATSWCGSAAVARSGCTSRSPPPAARRGRSGVAAGVFPAGRASPRCWRCRCSSRARAARSRPTSTPRRLCRRSAASSRCYARRGRFSPSASCAGLALSSAPNCIDSLGAPLLVSWQLTRDCDLCCLHCCTDSAPGKRWRTSSTPTRPCAWPTTSCAAASPTSCCAAASRSSSPTSSPSAEALGNAGVNLKIETNGQQFDTAVAARLARLPIRSIQVSLDGDTRGGLRTPAGGRVPRHGARGMPRRPRRRVAARESRSRRPGSTFTRPKP